MRKVEFIFHSQTELIHIKMFEKWVLNVQINFLDIFKSQNSHAVRWPVNCMSENQFFEVFVGLVFWDIISLIKKLSEQIVKNFNYNRHFFFCKLTSFCKLKVILSKLLDCFNEFLMLRVLTWIKLKLNSIINTCWL